MSDSFFLLFIPTFLMVSLTPGMCMTLSLTLGMTIGVRRTLWMMWGELAGVGLVAVSAGLGVATLALGYPSFFTAFKLCGGAYLVFLGVQLWRSRGRLAVSTQCGLGEDCLVEGALDVRETRGIPSLVSQGFVTAIANPKGWAFFIAFLPPFVRPDHALMPQLAWMTGLILLIEFGSLLAYAFGGQKLAGLLRQRDNVRLVNRLAGALMIGVAVWLVVA